MTKYSNIQLSLPFPNTADLRTEKAMVFGNRRFRKESYITKKNSIWDYKMGSGIGGGGQRRGGIEGDDCIRTTCFCEGVLCLA